MCTGTVEATYKGVLVLRMTKQVCSHIELCMQIQKI